MIFVKGVQNMYEVFEQLLQKFGVTTYQVSKATGIAQSTFSSWKTRKNLISGEKAKKIANYFGVTVDYLMTGKEESNEEKNLELTSRDERDVEKILNQTREQLLSQEGLMFDGDPASPEAIDSILSAMQIGMEIAKKKNKEKYTPKKYKKED